MQKADFKSVVWREEDKYVYRCLDLEVASFGKTKKEAIKNLQEALKLYFEDMQLPSKK